MLKKSILAVDIGAGSMKLLYGSKNVVLAHQMIDTPKGSVDDNKIVKIDEIFNLINEFIKKNRLKPNSISFSIYGQDMVIRHIEVPYMKESGVQQTVEWEIGQNLPEAGANYLIDYEILNKDDGKKTGTYRILAVAVTKDRVEKYLELANMLNIEINAIDISANCTSRVFKHLSKGKNALSNIGIIDIGHSNTGITLVDNGRLAIERQVPFGFDKLVKEISKTEPELINKEFEYLHHKYDMNKSDSEVNLKVNRLLDNVFTSFQKVIQFYTTGKIEKGISKLFIIGQGSTINGIQEIVNTYLSSPTAILKDVSEIGLKIKLPRGCEAKYHINTIGLLLRED